LCFSTLLRELAFFYILTPLYRSSADDTTKDEARSTQIRQIRDLIFPTAKQYLVPPVRLLNKKDVVLATSLESLYKV
jgi:DNA mismatch repair protein MLH1